MISYEKARAAFEQYLNGYDREAEKIRLKIVHTYGVVDCMREITGRMRLSAEDCRIAEVTALLHDIGRFEQLKRYDSFEPGTMDHASYGVRVLFEEGLIRRFVPESDWDDIIREAIAWHSAYAIGDIADERTLLHARLIRDADKMDNCRVKLTESVETLLGISAEEAGGEPVTDAIYETVMQGKCILLADRRTKADYWVSYIAYFYDIYFPETMQWILKQDAIRRTVDRITWTNPDTACKMREMQIRIQEYAEEFAGKGGTYGR